MKKRNLMALVMAGALLASTMVGCSQNKPAETTAATATTAAATTAAAADGAVSGTFEGTAVGMGGEKNPVKVTLTLADGKLTDVKIEGAGETPGIGSKAIDEFPKEMVDGNTVKVDAISGATITSRAVTEGVNGAVSYFEKALKGGN